MTAYEFTRFEADFTAKEKAATYDLGTIRFLIGYNNPGKDFTADARYEQAYDMFIELTMGCDYGEAVNWAKYWVMNAIAYGNQTKDRDWMYFFLAADDLYSYLLSQKCVGVHYSN